MAWQITDGTTTISLEVLNRPSLDAARVIDVSDDGLIVNYYGDALIDPKSLVLEVGISAGALDAAITTLRSILNLARLTSGAKVQYVEGSTTLERDLQGLQGYETTRFEPRVGILEVRFSLLPTGPYWTRVSDGAKLLWVF